MYAQQLTRSFIINMKGKKQNSFQKEKFWRKIETKNKIIALNVLFSASIGDEVNQVHLKTQFRARKQSNCLMITDGKKWHYLAVKSLSKLLQEITSKNDGKSYCINRLRYSKQKVNLNHVKM